MYFLQFEKYHNELNVISNLWDESVESNMSLTASVGECLNEDAQHDLAPVQTRGFHNSSRLKIGAVHSAVMAITYPGCV